MFAYGIVYGHVVGGGLLCELTVYRNNIIYYIISCVNGSDQYWPSVRTDYSIISRYLYYIIYIIKFFFICHPFVSLALCCVYVRGVQERTRKNVVNGAHPSSCKNILYI